MENKLKNYGDYVTLMNKIPKNKILFVNYKSFIWQENDYVYKLTGKEYSDLNEFQKELDIKNSLPKFEKCELIGYAIKNKKYCPIIKQRKIMSYVEMLCKYLEENGYTISKKDAETCCTINNIQVSDLYYSNIGFEEDGEIKIIDCDVHENTI